MLYCLQPEVKILWTFEAVDKMSTPLKRQIKANVLTTNYQ